MPYDVAIGGKASDMLYENLPVLVGVILRKEIPTGQFVGAEYAPVFRGPTLDLRECPWWKALDVAKLEVVKVIRAPWAKGV